jgi:hypothetical protein
MAARTLTLVLALIASAAVVSECQSHSTSAKLAPGLTDSMTVGFDIVPLPSAKGAIAWVATYTSHGKVAKFRVELGGSDRGDSSGPIDIHFGNGVIKAESGSDASQLLADLKKALEAKHLPKKVQRVDQLPFSYVILGENQSRAPGGGFNPSPPGKWTAMKIFLPQGGDGAEVFLDFSLELRKGEFSEKDVDYGDEVLARLATVL